MEKYIEYGGEIFRLTNKYYKRHITIFLHRQVWEDHFGPIPKGHHIHHKDGNKLNNAIENLECLEACEHHKRTWKDNYEKMRELCSKNLGKYKRTRKHRKKLSEITSKQWELRKEHGSVCKRCFKEFKTRMPTLAKWCSRKCCNAHHKEIYGLAVKQQSYSQGVR